MKRRIFCFVLVFSIIWSFTATWADTGARPEKWARPIAMAGAPNLHRVSPTLYRSAQPTAEGMKNLEALGIKTVVNLRSMHTDDDEIVGTGLIPYRIPMTAWRPDEDHAVRFLKVVASPENAPILVHCQHGADRTGALTAIYRIAVQGWTKKEAIREMIDGDYGFHSVWYNIPKWLQDLDMDRIRKEAGLAPAVKKENPPSPQNKPAD